MLQEASRLARLAAPVIVGQLSQVGIGFTDTVMAGRLGATELAAIAVGSSLWIPIYLGCLGVLMITSALTANLVGAGRLDRIGPLFRQALWLAAALALVAIPLTFRAPAMMEWLEVDPAVVPATRDYLHAVAWGMPGACLFFACRFVSEGMGVTRPLAWIQLTGLAVNALADYALMFGRFGMPAMGVEGAGWASAGVFWLNAVVFLAYLALSPRMRSARLFRHLEAPRPAELWRMLRLGLPVAASTLMEVVLFMAVALLMGRIGGVAVAAHQVAINYAALMFMVPLGVSMGISVRVGQAAGRGDRAGERVAGWTGMVMAVGFMLLSAAVMLWVPERIVAIYTDDPLVAETARGLLLMAALFQLSDGLQVSAVGALRGLRDTAVPMVITFVAYWLVGLPLAWWLGLEAGFGPQGLWMGLVAGLSVAALLLVARFRRLTV